MGHKNGVRGLSIFLFLASMGLTIAGNMLPVISTLQRTMTTSYQVTYTPWVTCGLGMCQLNDNDSVGCTELSSRLHVMAAFSLIHCVSVIAMIILLLAEMKGLRMPVQQLNYYMLAWTVFSVFLVWPLILGTLMAKMCGSVTSFEDLGGTLDVGFSVLVAAFGVSLLTAGIYVCGMNVREKDSVDIDQQPILSAPGDGQL